MLPPESRTNSTILFRALFPEIDDGLRIEIRAKSSNGGISQHFATSCEEASQLALHVAQQSEVWFGVGLRNGDHGDKDHVAAVGAVWADVDFKVFDDGETGAARAIEAFPLEPSIIVASGGGYQPYWLLNEMTAGDCFDRIEAVNRALTHALAPPGKRLDAAVDVSRVLRVPGTHNHKYDPPREVQIVSVHPELRYGITDLEDYVPSSPNFTKKGGGPAAVDLDGWRSLDPDEALTRAQGRLSYAAAGRLRGLLLEPEAYIPSKYPSRSEADFAAVDILVAAGLSDNEIAAVWLSNTLGERDKVIARPDYVSRTIAAARARRFNPTSDRKELGSEVRPREWNAGELQRHAKENGPPDIPFLPMLGLEGFLVEGWSHLLAGYPKSGKTELLARLIVEWWPRKVLYFTEEPELVWQLRLATLPERYDHVTLVFALGMSREEIRERITAASESVVVIDTIRHLLGLQDESNNSEIAAVLTPLIAVCRPSKKTILFSHHDRKAEGDHGKAIAGGSAFLGVVDVGLELLRDSQSERRRRIRGWGRVIEVPELLYEMTDQKELHALGSPSDLALAEVKKRVVDALTSTSLTTNEVRERLDDPKPSSDQVLHALNSLAAEGQAERDPPLIRGSVRGATYKWRRTNLTSDT